MPGLSGARQQSSPSRFRRAPVDNWSPRDIDQQRARFHQGKATAIDQVSRLAVPPCPADRSLGDPPRAFDRAGGITFGAHLRHNSLLQTGILIGKPTPPAPQLAKTLHTERHRKLRELLIARRKAAGLTQTVLAQRPSKPPSYVAKYELGERR